MGLITSINWTYGESLANLARMDAEPTTHECECPEPCNCDHENE